MLKIKFKIVSIVMLAFAITSCDSLFDLGDAEKVYTDVAQLEFAPLTKSISLASARADQCLVTSPATNVAGSTSVRVQLIGKQRSTPITANISVVAASTTLPAGSYSVPASVTIPANASFVDVVVTFPAGLISPGSRNVRLSLDSSPEDVKIAPNLKLSTITVVVSNPPAVPGAPTCPAP